MKLIDEWKSAWRYFSMQAMALGAGIQGAWLLLSPEMRAALPATVAGAVSGITFTLLVFGMGGRLVQQKPKDCDPK